MSEQKRGFTLTELLIVVAVIAVLVAVSIPIFSSQLEKSRRAVDLSNMKVISDGLSVAYLSNDLTFPKNYISVTVFSDEKTEGDAAKSTVVFIDGQGVSTAMEEKLNSQFGFKLDQMKIHSTKAIWKNGYTVVIDKQGNLSYSYVKSNQGYSDVWSFWDTRYHGFSPINDQNRDY